MSTSKSAARARNKAPQRRYPLVLEGELAEFHVTMSAPTGHELIRLRSGTMTEGEAIEFAVSKVVEHDFDADDLLELDAWILLAISTAWGEAMRNAAVPPTPASS